MEKKFKLNGEDLPKVKKNEALKFEAPKVLQDIKNILNV